MNRIRIRFIRGGGAMSCVSTLRQKNIRFIRLIRCKK